MDHVQGVQGQIDTGKSYPLAGKDRHGRTVIVVHVKHHDPKLQTVDELTRFGVYVLLRAEEALPPSPQTGSNLTFVLFRFDCAFTGSSP